MPIVPTEGGIIFCHHFFRIFIKKIVMANIHDSVILATSFSTFSVKTSNNRTIYKDIGTIRQSSQNFLC